MIDFSGYIDKVTYYARILGKETNCTVGNVEGLSYKLYRSVEQVRGIVVAYHGGGVNSQAGYGIFAQKLCMMAPLAVCLVDIRGHGQSDGARGTVDSPERIWSDVDIMLQEMKRLFPLARLYLFGHSSGAGMLLNYFTRHCPQHKVDGLFMLACELGPFANFKRLHDGSPPFAEINQWPFIINALSRGLFCGQTLAVKLHFSEEVLASMNGFVERYSVNMANALTPRYPDKQLAVLPLPAHFLIAEKDELFSPTEMEEFATRYGSPSLKVSVLPECSHLDCVFAVAPYLYKNLTQDWSNLRETE
ncbi:alpha/beta fold hydrolase [Xenorhabdus thuongxuanensis]|uniref:2-succinyl-6-hydroxy-2, 4-cyclohexadiene-1-carboxylate synthase n=1 Tax=Xenorhabdus thuongxuanensis TaxID=1873484 RepID=A0A1Q5TRH1_9GAMM|nr:alpha/beta fold hydrolase [Xenorhabdus thuongxuanensis]OKP02815.1 2-succinyl-6-hydroxy-2,4-cyclohexadiene-1-carboxylate synthase [Xenorhabdus thuongxuanensis]